MGIQRLTGKKVLITGAGKGIGRTLAKGFAQEGASVACVARTRQDLDSLVDEIASTGASAVSYPCDVSDREAVADVCDRIQTDWGTLDILIANAGGNFQRATVEESDPDVWDEIVQVNLYGVYYCAKYAIPLLKDGDGGTIITIGSGLGRKAKELRSAYAAAKAASWMLTRVLAAELREHNISVNELIPGPVETNQESLGLTNWRRGFEELGEWVKTPEDVLPLALFLATQPTIGPTAQSFSLMRREQ